jgi:hypothetical protein
MKRSQIRVGRVLKLSVLACYLLTTASPKAMPPMGRESDGVIQSVDRNKRILTIKMEGEPRLQVFEWNKDTRFLRDWKSTSSTDLKLRVRVRIRYHSPIFGKPYVTRVIFLKFGSIGTARPITELCCAPHPPDAISHIRTSITRRIFIQT